MTAAAAATHAITWRASTVASGSAEWATPPAIYAALDQEFGFTLDAAASAINAKHVRYVAKDTDALAISWRGERVFCNPPYGRVLGSWIRKALHAVDEDGAELVVLLLPARTDVAWFHELVLPRCEIRFIRGRLNYTRGGGGRCNAPFASMVVVVRPGAPLPGGSADAHAVPAAVGLVMPRLYLIGTTRSYALQGVSGIFANRVWCRP